MSRPLIKYAVSDLHGSTEAVSRDWSLLAERLVSVLSKLEEDQYLIVSAKNTNRFAQFACQGAWGMRVEVTSNHFLKGSDRLNRQQVSWLRSHGWNAPTGNFRESTPKKDPFGSPNYYFDFLPPLAVCDIARATIEAMVNALEIPYPASLVYEAFDDSQKVLSFVDLGLTRAIRYHRSLM